MIHHTIQEIQRKEHNKRYIEKLGYGYIKRPKGEIIWVHALGLGETLSLTLFIKTWLNNIKIRRYYSLVQLFIHLLHLIK